MMFKNDSKLFRRIIMKLSVIKLIHEALISAELASVNLIVVVVGRVHVAIKIICFTATVAAFRLLENLLVDIIV